MTISLRLNDEDTMLIKKYAEINKISVSELLRQTVMERIENEYDLGINNIVRSNYYDLKSKFADIGLDFIYLPYMMNKQQIEAKVRYYAPYLSSEYIATEVKSNVLAQYISDDEVRKNLKPSLIFGGSFDESNGCWWWR